MRLDTFAKNNIIMFLGSNVGSFFNLLYQLAMLRLVSKEAFASLNSLLSLLIIISVPSAAFTMMVTKYVSTHKARNSFLQLKSIWQKLAGHAFLFAGAIFILVSLLKVRISAFLHLGTPATVIILAGIFFLSGISPMSAGGLQGLEKFKWMAFIGITAGFLKLVLSVILVKALPNSLDAALYGILLSVAIGILLSLWPLRFLLEGKASLRVDLRQLYEYVLPVAAVSMCFALLTNVDMVLVKHFFKAEAQDYSVAQMIGKIILSIAGVVCMVMFSRVSNLHAVNESSKNILKRSLLFTFALSLPAVAFYNIFPQFTFKILAGGAADNVVRLARVFSLSMLFYAMSNVLFYYQLSIERYGFLRPLILLSVLQAVIISLFHITTFQVAGIMLVNSLVIFVLNLRSSLKVAV